MAKEAAVSIEVLTRRIHLIRSHKVMLDSDLARLYHVPTKRLNEQVRRNRDRFPPDFAFQLSPDEAANLRSQIATSSYGGRRYAPLAFTEHGTIMAAAVLNSPRAVQMSIFVVRAFVQLRELIATHKALEGKLDELERRISGHDKAIAEIIATIRRMVVRPEPSRRGIGFTADVG